MLGIDGFCLSTLNRFGSCIVFFFLLQGDQVAMVIRTGDLVQQIFGEEEEAKIECPTCRGPMGEGKSMLSKVKIFNKY